MSNKRYPQTPDGRYFVARGRLWRKSDPRLAEADRQHWVNALMAARRGVKDAGDDDQRRDARRHVNDAKQALGERGPVWWDDGAPDETRMAPKNSRYADWWAALDDDTRAAGS